MKNSYEVNIGKFCDVKREYLGGRDYSPMYVNNNNRNESSIIIFYAMINVMMT